MRTSRKRAAASQAERRLSGFLSDARDKSRQDDDEEEEEEEEEEDEMLDEEYRPEALERPMSSAKRRRLRMDELFEEKLKRAMEAKAAAEEVEELDEGEKRERHDELMKECAGWLDVPEEAFDIIVRCLRAEDMVGLACTNKSFHEFSKNHESFWDREYSNHPLVRAVFQGYRMSLHGTVPPGFTKRTFVAAQVSGRCFFCKRKSFKTMCGGTPMCSKCGDSDVRNELFVNKVDSLTRFEPAIPRHILANLPVIVSSGWSVGDREDFNLGRGPSREHQVFLARDLDWLNESNPYQRRRRAEAEARKQRLEVQEEIRRDTIRKTLMKRLGKKNMQHPLVHEILDGRFNLSGNMEDIREIVLRGRTRRRQINAELERAPLSEFGLKIAQPWIESFVTMRSPDLSSLMKDIDRVKKALTEIDTKHPSLSMEVRDCINLEAFRNQIRCLDIDTLIQRAKLEHRINTEIEKCPENVKVVVDHEFVQSKIHHFVNLTCVRFDDSAVSMEVWQAIGQIKRYAEIEEIRRNASEQDQRTLSSHRFRDIIDPYVERNEGKLEDIVQFLQSHENLEQEWLSWVETFCSSKENKMEENLARAIVRIAAPNLKYPTKNEMTSLQKEIQLMWGKKKHVDQFFKSLTSREQAPLTQTYKPWCNSNLGVFAAQSKTQFHLRADQWKEIEARHLAKKQMIAGFSKEEKRVAKKQFAQHLKDYVVYGTGCLDEVSKNIKLQIKLMERFPNHMIDMGRLQKSFASLLASLRDRVSEVEQMEAKMDESTKKHFSQNVRPYLTLTNDWYPKLRVMSDDFLAHALQEAEVKSKRELQIELKLLQDADPEFKAWFLENSDLATLEMGGDDDAVYQELCSHAASESAHINDILNTLRPALRYKLREYLLGVLKAFVKRKTFGGTIPEKPNLRDIAPIYLSLCDREKELFESIVPYLADAHPPMRNKFGYFFPMSILAHFTLEEITKFLQTTKRFIKVLEANKGGELPKKLGKSRVMLFIMVAGKIMGANIHTMCDSAKFDADHKEAFQQLRKCSALTRFECTDMIFAMNVNTRLGRILCTLNDLGFGANQGDDDLSIPSL